MSVIVALFLDYQFGTAIFQLSNTKRQVTLFLYIGPHPFYRPAHRQDFGMGTIAKVQKVSEIHKESGKFFKVQIRICYNSGTVHSRLPNVLVRQVKCAVWGENSVLPQRHFAWLRMASQVIHKHRRQLLRAAACDKGE